MNRPIIGIARAVKSFREFRIALEKLGFNLNSKVYRKTRNKNPKKYIR